MLQTLPQMISVTRSSSTDDSLVKPESGDAARPIFFKSLFKGHTGLQRQTSDDTAKTTDADGLSVCSEGGNDCNDFDDDLDVAPIKTGARRKETVMESQSSSLTFTINDIHTKTLLFVHNFMFRFFECASLTSIACTSSSSPSLSCTG